MEKNYLLTKKKKKKKKKTSSSKRMMENKVLDYFLKYPKSISHFTDEFSTLNCE